MEAEDGVLKKRRLRDERAKAGELVAGEVGCGGDQGHEDVGAADFLEFADGVFEGVGGEVGILEIGAGVTVDLGVKEARADEVGRVVAVAQAPGSGGRGVEGVEFEGVE